MPEPQILRVSTPFKGKVTRLPLDAQAEGTLIDSLDVVPFDCKTGRARLSVRPGYGEVSDLNDVVGFAVLPAACAEPGAVQLMAIKTTGSTCTLYRLTSAGAWESVGTVTDTISRTIHMAPYGKRMFVACDGTYKYYDYDFDNDGVPHYTPDAGDTTVIGVWEDTTVAGTIPPNCRLCCTWGSRIVLANSIAGTVAGGYPHQINFSRVDDPFDWDVGQDDSGAAVSVSVGEAITCLIPHNNDCLIVGCKNGMHIFTGNPTQGGTLEKFAFVVGPVNSSAWCKSANDDTYFIAHNGLYKIPPGCGSPPVSLSREIIPDGLLGIDGVASKAYLVYNERFRCVEIHTQGTVQQSWLYDVDTGGFWPITAPGSSILAAHYFGYLDSATASGSMIGTSSGVKRMDNAVANGTNAYATFLFNLAHLGNKALVQRVTIDFDNTYTNDSTGTVALYGGSTADLAAALSVDRKQSISIAKLLLNHGAFLCRVGGKGTVMKITQGSGSAYWTMEGAALSVLPAGKEHG